jgi:hypothetical protein
MIEVGKYSIISLQEAVESAKEMLRIQDTTEFDGFLLRKADEAMRHIGDDTTYAKRACTLDIVDGRSKLPMGFIRLLGARMSDSNGNCFDQPYLDLPFLTDCGCESPVNSNNGFNNPFQIQAGYMVFHDPSELETTKVRVAYISRNVDDDGLMLMSERHERAIEAYLCYQFTLSFFENYPVNIRQDYQRTWKNQKQKLKGMGQRERFEENKREIAAILNAWITSDRNDR